MIIYSNFSLQSEDARAMIHRPNDSVVLENDDGKTQLRFLDKFLHALSYDDY